MLKFLSKLQNELPEDYEVYHLLKFVAIYKFGIAEITLKDVSEI